MVIPGKILQQPQCWLKPPGPVSYTHLDVYKRQYRSIDRERGDNNAGNKNSRRNKKTDQSMEKRR